MAVLGTSNLAVTANTYTHVLSDETELDYGAVLKVTREEARLWLNDRLGKDDRAESWDTLRATYLAPPPP